jgi:tyrosyl-tRNA synthetase
MEKFPHNEDVDFSKKLNVKFGIDPTSDRLHLGHLVPLKFVKKLKDEGHHIDIVLGTFTAQLGDPSGKDLMRPMIDAESTSKNADSILRQVQRVLGEFQVHFNHTWFQDMSAIEMMGIIAKFNTNHLLCRDSFQKRIEIGNSIGMHELIVPILQGFDSVKLNTDIEIGGSDQLFNFTITRDLQKAMGQKPEVCFMMPIINGTDGRKMSKSFNNCIFLDDSPVDVFGKTMSASDSLMREWFPIFLDGPIGKDIMNEKKRLAFQITKEIWTEEDALNAQKHFEEVIQNRNLPQEMTDICTFNMVDAIKILRNCSASEARRLLQNNAVSVNGEKVLNEIVLNSGDIIKVGKLNFGKII